MRRGLKRQLATLLTIVAIRRADLHGDSVIPAGLASGRRPLARTIINLVTGAVYPERADELSRRLVGIVRSVQRDAEPQQDIACTALDRGRDLWAGSTHKSCAFPVPQ